MGTPLSAVNVWIPSPSKPNAPLASVAVRVRDVSNLPELLITPTVVSSPDTSSKANVPVTVIVEPDVPTVIKTPHPVGSAPVLLKLVVGQMGETAAALRVPALITAPSNNNDCNFILPPKNVSHK